MTAPVSKTQQCISLFKAGKHKEWLRIIDGWRASRVVSATDLAVFKRGYGCLVNPSFYKQVGWVPAAEVEKAKALFYTLFIEKKEKA